MMNSTILVVGRNNPCKKNFLYSNSGASAFIEDFFGISFTRKRKILYKILSRKIIKKGFAKTFCQNCTDVCMFLCDVS